jgi:hypothetical protein
MLTKGAVFIHDTFLDLEWVPGQWQTYADAPKAPMKVFRVDAHTVWYGYTWLKGRAAGGWTEKNSRTGSRIVLREPVPCPHNGGTQQRPT